MNKKGFLGYLVVLGIFFLSSCTPAKTESPLATEETVVTESVATSAPEAGECLACHTDKQRLIDTAEPVVEAAESDSKGVG